MEYLHAHSHLFVAYYATPKTTAAENLNFIRLYGKNLTKLVKCFSGFSCILLERRAKIRNATAISTKHSASVWIYTVGTQSVEDKSHSGHKSGQMAMSRHTNSHVLPTTNKSNDERLLRLVTEWTWIGIPPLYHAAITCWCSLSEKSVPYCISYFSHPIYYPCTTFALPTSSSIPNIRGHIAGPPAPSPLRYIHA